MAKAAHVAIAFVILKFVWCKATTSSPSCLASEECGASSQASMLLQVARSRDSKPVSMEEMLQHTEPLQSKLDDLNQKVTKLETVFGRNRGEDSKKDPSNDEERKGANSDEEQKEETKGGKNIGRRRRKKGGEYKDVEKKVAKDAKKMPTMGPRNHGENSEEDVNNEEEPTMKPDEKPNKNEDKEPDNEEKSELQKKVGRNARRRKQAKKHYENTKHEGGTILNKEEDWAWMDHKNAGEDVKRLKKGQECCDYPGNRPNKQCKTTCGHGLMCIFVGEEVGPPTCVEEEFDKRSLANVPSWDGVAPRAWNGLETVNAGDQGKKASWKGKGRGVASGRAYSGEYPYETLMDVDFVIDSNPPWPSRRRKQARRQPKVGAKTSPRNGAKSSPRNGGKSSPRDGAKSSPRDGAKSGALEGKSSARSGAKTSPTDKKSRKAPKSSARSLPEP